jgi:2-oxoglutarate/2-oxoacid ferredoxin oxidoreductase subunit alpha
MLFPSNPKECFDHTATALDLANRLQTPVIVMTDLDLGMNEHMSPPLAWDDDRAYDPGKVLSAEDLENMGQFGRYLDVDGDGIPYRTIPGTHPTKGAFFTRGTSKDEYARYTELGAAYVRNVDRLKKKFNTISQHVPPPELYQEENQSRHGVIFFGTTTYAALEAMELLRDRGIVIDAMRIIAFPFNGAVAQFIEEHEQVFVVEQNRDGQLRSLLINELEIAPQQLVSILNYDGMPITADAIEQLILRSFPEEKMEEVVELAGK